MPLVRLLGFRDVHQLLFEVVVIDKHASMKYSTVAFSTFVFEILMIVTNMTASALVQFSHTHFVTPYLFSASNDF